MAEYNSEKSATDQNHESYNDNSKARRVVLVNSSGSVLNSTLTASAPSFATVGTISASVVNYNLNRKALIITNTSGTNVSLGFDNNDAVLNSGVTLINSTFNMTNFVTTGTINAIADLGGSNLSIQEFE